MSEGPLESVKSDIVIEFESSAQAKIIYDSIILEFIKSILSIFNKSNEYLLLPDDRNLI